MVDAAIVALCERKWNIKTVKPAIPQHELHIIITKESKLESLLTDSNIKGKIVKGSLAKFPFGNAALLTLRDEYWKAFKGIKSNYFVILDEEGSQLIAYNPEHRQQIEQELLRYCEQGLIY